MGRKRRIREKRCRPAEAVGPPPEAWMKRGIASDNPFTVRAIAFIIAGHVVHHVAILRERYL